MQAQTDLEVMQMIMPMLQNVVQYVINKIWEENQALIELYIYEGYTPKIYERTTEFKQAWNTDMKPLGQHTSEGELKYNPDVLHTNYEKWQHGSKMLLQPLTEYLAQVIYQGKSGSLFGNGPWRQPRNVWQLLLKELGAKTLDKYFLEAFNHFGVSIKKGREAIHRENYEYR